MTGDDDDERGGARNTDPETSHLAADSVNVTKLNAMVLDFLVRTSPRTWAAIEIARHLGVHPWSISPRMAQLKDKGLVVDLPKEYRLNSNNKMRPMIVWRAIEPREAEAVKIEWNKNQASWGFDKS
jgi:hypothetical protein